MIITDRLQVLTAPLLHCLPLDFHPILSHKPETVQARYYQYPPAGGKIPGRNIKALPPTSVLKGM